MLPISAAAKGVLFTILFGLAKTCQYGGLTILGVEGYVVMYYGAASRYSGLYILGQAVEGADKIATLMNLSPLGAYELSFAFGDITYSYEEDKANWRLYAMQGWIPKWLYFVKFEKMSEEDAKAMIAEAQAADMEVQLFQQQLSNAGGED